LFKRIYKNLHLCNSYHTAFAGHKITQFPIKQFESAPGFTSKPIFPSGTQPGGAIKVFKRIN